MPVTPREEQEGSGGDTPGIQTRAQAARDAARLQSFDLNRTMEDSQQDPSSLLLAMQRMMEDQARRQEEQNRDIKEYFKALGVQGPDSTN